MLASFRTRRSALSASAIVPVAASFSFAVPTIFARSSFSPTESFTPPTFTVPSPVRVEKSESALAVQVPSNRMSVRRAPRPRFEVFPIQEDFASTASLFTVLLTESSFVARVRTAFVPSSQ